VIREALFTAVLVLLVVCAVQVILAKHQNRKVFVELQELEKERDQLNEDWGRLQLERATWGTHGRVEELAREKLAMIRPDHDDIVLVVP